MFYWLFNEISIFGVMHEVEANFFTLVAMVLWTLQFLVISISSVVVELANDLLIFRITELLIFH